MKALFILICLVGLALSSIACAWFPWWLAAPISVALGVILAVAGEELRDSRRRRDRERELRKRPQPQPRFTPRMYHRN
jgi:Flp pilus assembly protein TadB